jgi:hypothetical protein
MMTMPKMHYARASAAAIAASLALSPTYGAPPKPIVDLSKSPALSEDKAPPPPPAKKNSGPIDEQTMELGGGALAVLVLGGAALAISARRRRRERESWELENQAAEARMAEAAPEAAQLADEEPVMVQPPMSAFDWNKEPRRETAEGDCEELESRVDRAKCGPTPDNPSQSLKKRMKRAAFFEKRDREVAAGEAAPVEPDAGLPENLEETA